MGHSAAKRRRRILSFKATRTPGYRALLGLFGLVKPVDRASRRRALRAGLKALGA